MAIYIGIPILPPKINVLFEWPYQRNFDSPAVMRAWAVAGT
jgi:hypothetical protein